MASGDGGTGGWIRQVRGLFGLGTVGGMSDAQLLDAFVGRRGDASEAAFEELMQRHGPMVLRICRGALRDPQDAEDAFQATFLVLAHRAGSIRRRDSVASWLFGVSQRVAAQARLRAARRRAGERHVAERTPEAYRPAEHRDEPDALIEEIGRLPERLRTVVVLCYLEGLSYDAAARRLGLSEATIRGRLARARVCLRRRLTRRGAVIPAGLLAAEGHAGAAASAPLAAALVDSTTRVVAGFQAGDAAAILARGVLRSMFLGHLRSAAVLLLAVLGTSLMAWHTLAARDDGKARPAQQPGPARVASPKAERPAEDPGRTYPITGRVIVEGTDEPVPGATLEIVLGFYSGNEILDESQDLSRTVRTGADGRFRAELPAGYAAMGRVGLPPGYYSFWQKVRPDQDIILTPGAPIARKEYAVLVRRGTAWDFQVSGRSGGPLESARVYFMSLDPKVPDDFKARTDQSGKASLTLPSAGGKLTGHVSHDALSESINLELQWDSGFRPDAVRSIARAPGEPGRFRLTDERGTSAGLRVVSQAEQRRALGLRDAGASTTIIGADAIDLVIERGKLATRVVLTEPANPLRGALTGLVLDPGGRPVAGARVALASVIDRGREGVLSNDQRDWATSDAQGRYRIDAVRPAGEPTLLQLVVTKPGFARVESEAFALEPGRDGRPRELAPIRLGPDVTLSGTVLDPQGRPVEGAWVEISPRSIRNENQSARTDSKGRFAFAGISRGANRLNVRHGELHAGDSYPSLDSSREVVIRLRPRPSPAAPPQAAPAAAATPRSPATGQPAPAWDVGKWSDGKARQLADFRDKVVFLDFWGIWCGPCISSLPVLTRLKERFEPRGVVFLSIHTPGDDESAINRVLAVNQSQLVYAIDRSRGADDDRARGITADRYGIRGVPSVFLIDRDGKIALRDGDPSVGPKVQALMKELGIAMGPNGVTEEQSRVLLERLFAGEIEALLKARE